MPAQSAPDGGVDHADEASDWRTLWVTTGAVASMFAFGAVAQSTYIFVAFVPGWRYVSIVSRVIVNARTGTVVVNSAVRVGPAAVTHGRLTVRIDEAPRVVQPAPLSNGVTALEQRSNVQVEEKTNPMFLLDPGPRLADIVKAVNGIGASPADLVAILEALKEAGSLKAELIVL